VIFSPECPESFDETITTAAQSRYRCDSASSSSASQLSNAVLQN
jgi:hypothetical protein